MQRHQKGARGLAEPTSVAAGADRAIREHQEREELRALYHAMPRKGRIGQTGASRWRFYESAPGTAKRNPCADLVADARAAIATGATEAQVVAPFERMLTLVRGACRSHEGDLPSALALELDETREQGQADVAVRTYCNEPDVSARKASLGALAIREISDHLTALSRLRDRLRHDRVISMHRGPRLLAD